MQSETPLICDLTVDSGQRARHQAVLQELRSAVRAVRELTDGYAFCLPADPDPWKTAAEFASLERLCCPFLASGLDLEAGGGPLWPRVTGRAGVKAFLRAELGLSHRLTGP